MQSYENKKQQLTAQLRANQRPVRLGKSTSNLFRVREKISSGTVDVKQLNQVLAVDPGNRTVETEGMTTYETLTDACLERHCMPCVVPQLKSITIGGAVSGIGIESTSFRHGLPHESVLEMDVLLASGEVLTCTPENECSDLFFGIPNSYGTLGYVIRLTARTLPVKRYVSLEHIRFTDRESYFAAVKNACDGDADFVDGSIFDHHEMYLTLGRFVDNAPYTSDYTWMSIYYRSIQNRRQDFLTTRDYLWRWDTDWFWCSRNFFAQNSAMRLLLGRRHLNSVTYQKIMRWNSQTGFTATFNKLFNLHNERVIQDVDIPIEQAPEFLRFLLSEIGIRPIWMCPIDGHDPSRNFPLYPLHASGLFVNFGFWGSIPNPDSFPAGHFNRLVEQKVHEHGGIKSLYSDSYYSEEQFWKIYDGDIYRSLKQKYDPQDRLKNLYQKCVLNS